MTVDISKLQSHEILEQKTINHEGGNLHLTVYWAKNEESPREYFTNLGTMYSIGNGVIDGKWDQVSPDPLPDPDPDWFADGDRDSRKPIAIVRQAIWSAVADDLGMFDTFDADGGDTKVKQVNVNDETISKILSKLQKETFFIFVDTYGRTGSLCDWNFPKKSAYDKFSRFNGIAFVPKDEARDLFKNHNPEDVEALAKNQLLKERREYNNWTINEVYRWTIRDDDGTEISSGGPYYSGNNIARLEANEELQRIIEDRRLNPIDDILNI